MYAFSKISTWTNAFLQYEIPMTIYIYTDSRITQLKYLSPWSTSTMNSIIGRFRLFSVPSPRRILRFFVFLSTDLMSVSWASCKKPCNHGSKLFSCEVFNPFAFDKLLSNMFKSDSSKRTPFELFELISRCDHWLQNGWIVVVATVDSINLADLIIGDGVVALAFVNLYDCIVIGSVVVGLLRVELEPVGLWKFKAVKNLK